MIIKLLKDKVPLNKDVICFDPKIGPKIVSNINPFTYNIIRKNIELYQKIDILTSDGILLTFLLKVFLKIKTERISMDMSSMFSVLFKKYTLNSFYFIGTKENIIDKTIENIKNRFPDLNVIGFRNGYFSDNEERLKTIKNITNLNPDYLIVGMGSPLQDQFAVDMLQNGYKGIIYTCGGFLHQASKKLDYFTPFQNKLGIRWLFRIFKEPYVLKRLIINYPKFLVSFSIDYIKGRYTDFD